VYDAAINHEREYPNETTKIEKVIGDQKPANIWILLTQLTAKVSYSGPAGRTSLAAANPIVRAAARQNPTIIDEMAAE